MSTATRTAPESPALQAADSHDLIRVHGARVNNLKDVSVEIPKRRLTVFTGVSGSGKSSLVFDTIAAGATAKKPSHDVDDGRLVATVTDPDGNVLGLLQDR